MTVPRLPFHDPPVPQNPVTASSAWIVLVVQVTGNGPMMTTVWEGLVVARLEAAAAAAAVGGGGCGWGVRVGRGGGGGGGGVGVGGGWGV